MKKTLALLLAAIMLLACIPASLAETKEISVMIWYRDIDDLDFANMPYFNDPENGITAQSGTHATFNQVKGSDWSTKVNLMLASGEYPDVIVRGGLNLEMYGVDQEILIPLDDVIDQYMPNYKAYLDADPALAQSLKSSNGKTYQIGWLIPQNINTDSHLFINKVWLDNLGLSVPTTVEEFEKVLIAFRDQDADGDGNPSNEIPMGGTLRNLVDGIAHLMNFWGVAYNDIDIALDDEGRVYSPLTAEGLRPALETISRWYNEGLIDVEAVSQDSNAAEAKINAGNVGVTWRWRMSAMGTDEAIYTQYTCVIPFSADGYHARLQRYLEIPSFGAAITAGCKDVEAAAKWLDTQFAWENMISGYNGAKGEFWFYNDDNMVELVPMSDGTRTVPGQSSMMYCSGDEYFSKVVMASHRIEKTEYCKAYEEAGVIEKNSWNILSRLISLTVEESTEKDLLFAEIHKYANESLSNFIVKGVTDDGWNTYMNTLNSLRLSDYMNLYQTAYDRYVEANQ
ncbi:MAG: extracellular solute-binding protein [Clostridia bacterium]|nr:extracellular solute-binding protein [Clostridia bacterium]